MENLKTAGLILRTLKPVEYAKLIEDLQYNFTQILNAPGFRGRPGASVQGETGIGTRGTKWVFVELNRFSASYGTTSAEQISLSFINQIFVDDSTKFFESLYIPNDTSLIIGDILVLPSGQLIELIQTVVNSSPVIKFVDTSITFAQVTQLTESRVVEIFNNLYVDSGAQELIFRQYNALAKNVSDAQPALNQSMNQNSAIDIGVSESGPGYLMNNWKFISPTEQSIDTLTKMCLIAGSAKRYHELVQNTQQIHTNNYLPGVDDFGALVMLQNSYKNGLLFGNSESETIRQFGRLYRSESATVLTSSYSPLASEYSEMQLSDTSALIRSLNATLNVTSLDVLASVYTSPHYSYSGNVSKIGNKANASVEIYGPNGVSLQYVKNANFLSTDANGKIVSTYSIIHSLTGTLSTNQIISAPELLSRFTGISSTLTSHDSRITALEGGDNSKFFQKLSNPTGTVNFNSLTSHGNLYVSKSQAISNFIADVFTAPEDLHVNTFVSTGTGSEIRLMQEVTFSGSTILANFMKGVKYFRVGSKSGNGQWTFSNWSKTLTSNDTVKPGQGLVGSGSFTSNDITISHALKSQSAQSSNNTGNTVLQNVVIDEFGHIVSMQSSEVIVNAGSSLRAKKCTLSTWAKDRRHSLQHYIPEILNGTAEIMSAIPTLRCISPEHGYSVGDVVTAQVTGLQDAFNSSDYDYGMTVRWRTNHSYDGMSVYVGDIIYIREGLTVANTASNCVQPTVSKWVIDVTVYYQNK